jgi:ankyrin repeat protein
LEYAIQIGNPDMVQYLLDLGADVNTVNVIHDSETTLHFAVKEEKKGNCGSACGTRCKYQCTQ